ncbi:hypothetical protein IJO12_04750 [bacterium]|nr:hypothetical protein [bacterium]
MKITAIKNILSNNCQKCLNRNSYYKTAPLKSDMFCKKYSPVLSMNEAKKYLQKIREQNMSGDDKITLIMLKMRYLEENQIIKQRMNYGEYYTNFKTENIAKTLEGKCINQKIILYRGFALDDFGYDINDKNAINEFYEKGKIITYPIFLSTSLDKDTASKFPWYIKKEQRYIMKIYTDNVIRGIYLENMLSRREKEDLYYDFPNEEEVYVDRLLKLQMLDKYKDDEGRVIIETLALGHDCVESFKQKL